MTYQEQLKNPLWLSKRNQIIERDFRICQHCMIGKNLEVHHTAYIKGRMAWDYADQYLITLCASCHEQEHKTKVIPILEEPQDMWGAWDRIARSVRALIGLGHR